MRVPFPSPLLISTRNTDVFCVSFLNWVVCLKNISVSIMSDTSFLNHKVLFSSTSSGSGSICSESHVTEIFPYFTQSSTFTPVVTVWASAKLKRKEPSSIHTRIAKTNVDSGFRHIRFTYAVKLKIHIKILTTKTRKTLDRTIRSRNT